MSENSTQNEKGSDSHPRVVAVIPAYNEERFIGSVVLKARKYADAVIVVDDGSSDATGEIAEAAGAIVVRHEPNRGKGAALNTGLRKARELGAKAVALLDGDGQHRPEEMPGVLAPILRGEADVVAGSRYLEERGPVPRHRVWGHRVFTLLTNLLSGTQLTDSQSGFRAFSSNALEAVSFSSNGFSVESEMQFLIGERNLSVVEAPVTTLYRDKPKRNVVVHGLAVLNGVLRLIGQYRPLLFFGGFGSAGLIFGLLWGARVVDIYGNSQQLAVGYALIAVLLCILGAVSFSTGIILHSLRGLLLDLVGQRRP